MRFAVVLLIAAAWGSLALAQAPDLASMDIVERSLPDGPVALVRGDAIEKRRFLFLYHTELAAARMASGNENLPEEARVRIGIGSVTELIQRQILLQEARKRKLSVSDGEVEAIYKKEMDHLREEFTQRSQQEVTEAEILTRANQTRGEALEELREIALVEKVREALVKEHKVSVTDADIRNFYDSNPQIFKRGGRIHLRQIYVKPKPNGREASEQQWQSAEKRILEAQARVRAGETFAAVAKALSESGDKDNGGDMGPVPAEQLPPFYVESSRRLTPGAISDVIKSEHGYHLIQLQEQSDGGDVPFEMARERIERVLKTAKSEQVVDAFCQPVAQDASQVQIFLDLERSLAAYLSRNGARGGNEG